MSTPRQVLRGIDSTTDQGMPVPDGVVASVAWDRTCSKLYVERRRMGDPLLLTWLDRMRLSGEPLTVEPREIDEIVKMRAEGLGVTGSADLVDLRNREQAMQLLRQGARLGASDIHLLLRDGFAEAQVRIKGDLKVMQRRFSSIDGEAISRALFQSIATVKDQSYNPMVFQNAQISGEVLSGLGLSSIRLVRGPCFPNERGGGFVVLRLQYTHLDGSGSTTIRADAPVPVDVPRIPAGTLRLDAMGFTPWQIEALTTLACAPNGIILFTGPTGSGKTTTLAEMLRHGARLWPERRQVTIEDPVEYPMDWAVQLAVTNARTDDETGDVIAEMLRVALRMDPDTILVGEIRGAKSAISALNAALTGHQVWSTLHVTDPYLFVDRMELMDPLNLNRRVFCDHSIVRGVIAQRLVPRLCSQCSLPAADSPVLTQRVREAVATWCSLDQVRVRGPGCPDCGMDSVSGRIAVAEVVVTDAELMKNFITLGTEEARRCHRARTDTDGSLLDNVMDHVSAGRVDPRDVEKTVDIIARRA